MADTLSHKLTLKRIRIDRLFQIDVGKLRSRFIIRKSDVAFALLYLGVLIAYLGSLNPWFMWKLNHIYPIIASMPVVVAWLLSRTLKEQLFTRTDYKYPAIAFIVISLYMAIVNDLGMNGYIIIVFKLIVFMVFFSLKIDFLRRLMKWMCVTMALMMMVSIPYYFLYLLGFSLPNSSVENEDLMYSFYNYYLFLLDNRIAADAILPRFHSVFLEPGHLGSACVFLLMTQISHWRKWYNVILFITVALTFSLAAYLLMTVLYFISVWLRRKNLWARILIISAVLTVGCVFAYNYNRGDNLVNIFILERLEINDEGKFEGDNRVTEEFDDEFDDFMSSSDVLFGRKFEISKYGWGNSGYRVFIYDYGLMFVLLLILFYLICIHHATNVRAKLVVFAFGAVTFWARSNLLDFFDFFPLYAMAYITPIFTKFVGNEKSGSVDHNSCLQSQTSGCGDD